MVLRDAYIAIALAAVPAPGQTGSTDPIQVTRFFSCWLHVAIDASLDELPHRRQIIELRANATDYTFKKPMDGNPKDNDQIHSPT